jgi:hypothetical protein
MSQAMKAIMRRANMVVVVMYVLGWEIGLGVGIEKCDCIALVGKEGAKVCSSSFEDAAPAVVVRLQNQIIRLKEKISHTAWHR